jgi:hypothetical protein
MKRILETADGDWIEVGDGGREVSDEEFAAHQSKRGAYAAAGAIYDALPAWQRLYLEPMRAGIAAALQAGDFAAAYDIISDTPAAAYPGIPANDFEAIRSQFLALFQ